MAGYGQMMQQMKKMQRDIELKQGELNAREFNASSGSGMVSVRALGTKEITEVIISPELLKDEDAEMVGELVRLAVNTVIKEIETTTEAELSKLTGGINLPGLF